MKKFFLYTIALFFPWVLFLIYKDIGGALITLILQTTVIGWLPASIWAWNTIKKHQ